MFCGNWSDQIGCKIEIKLLLNKIPPEIETYDSKLSSNSNVITVGDRFEKIYLRIQFIS